MWNPQVLTRDFGQLCRYRDQNAEVKAQKVRIVFMGGPITGGWINLDGGFFVVGLVYRGISGQTTPRMLVRFRQNVLELKRRAVHIMAGTNEIARANSIKVILASIPPAGAFPCAKDERPVPKISASNAWARSYAQANGFTFVGYHAATAQPGGAIEPGLSSDGMHPTAPSYAVMRPLAVAAIAKTLSK
ncbi:GDSL-type esterase/lipase family protein [Sphingomonas xinjiangensis]|uniref:Lysophospholipase L1-like esterase n=1 Tax=Sphingomonas xinjiangensis TaxID=643568 RepID=A0A840YSA0_9SPHN|nr:GDSL-type esterase/lipase family protein [Sphingomonas xinjiangensis]MBB5712547.1 lysophospholipase L1-like esterase [Sphingomonas xinjiangensis]